MSVRVRHNIILYAYYVMRAAFDKNQVKLLRRSFSPLVLPWCLVETAAAIFPDDTTGKNVEKVCLEIFATE